MMQVWHNNEKNSANMITYKKSWGKQDPKHNAKVTMRRKLDGKFNIIMQKSTQKWHKYSAH